jgi:hypothetical protein
MLHFFVFATLLSRYEALQAKASGVDMDVLNPSNNYSRHNALYYSGLAYST